MNTGYFKYTTLVAAMALSACSSIPDKNAALEEARNAYIVAQNTPDVIALAGSEFKQATDAMNKANNAWADDEEKAKVDHLAYLAKQRVAITQEAARLRAAEIVTAGAGAERDKLRLAARTREADAANVKAAASKRAADNAQKNADASQRQLDESQRDAASQQQRASDAEARGNQLEAQLANLQAKKTNRGIIVTFSDVLFDLDMAQIRSGGIRNVQKLADVLKQYPERNVLIEGFTDSTGDHGHNQLLSDRRADAVRTALRDMGISNSRITGRGYGETFPVATNDTAAGRQLNRRVEVIISDADGLVAPR
jgi:outer membrane protein OmpA-like peptidoglycan-associated protein